jgi:osmoprotectant transport system substrate-binding protein
MRIDRRGVLAVVVVVVALVGSACGSDNKKSATKTKAASASTVVIGSAPFSESVILANIYGKALAGEGVKVTLKTGLGQREVYEPALERGGRNSGIDLVPEYVGTLLEFLNKNAGEATGELQPTVDKLRARLESKGLTALDASPAADQNAFAVTRATADKRHLAKLSDVAPIGSQLTLGAGSECPTRPFCIPGLEKTYGIKFKAFRVLDSGGPKTKDALTAGDIDVGLVFSSDGAVVARNFVILDDDKHLQSVDNVIPVIRNDVLNDRVRAVLNRVSAALTTSDLSALNKRADVDKQDPDLLAAEWLKSKGFKTG